MNDLKEHIIDAGCTLRDALAILDKQGLIANVLFVVDSKGVLLGSLTDGDVRRSFLKGLEITSSVQQAMKRDCHFLKKDDVTNKKEMDLCKSLGIGFLPVVDDEKRILYILNLKNYKSFIALDAVLMAGGKGKRLHPLTEHVPKPLLKIGDRPILEHNIDRLKTFGIENIFISINYLGDQLIEYFGDGYKKGINISYIKEKEPLGTIGSIKLAEEDFVEETILVMNSDLLTNIDFAEFYEEFISTDADMAVAATSYHVDVPYAVLEIEEDNNTVRSLKEKPRYTFYSNAGIYLIKRSVLSYIPEGKSFDSTDLMEILIKEGKKLITYPILGYWLDIGKLEDYKKAQEDIKHIDIHA